MEGRRAAKRIRGSVELIAGRSRRIHLQGRCKTEANKQGGKADVSQEESY